MGWTRRFSLTVLVLLALCHCAASAAPITLVPNTVNMFRDSRAANDVGIRQGELFQFGADIVGGSAGTTLGAVYPPTGFTVPQFVCSPLAVNVNFCSNSTVFNSLRLQPWTLIFENGPDVLQLTGPSLAGTENPVPFPQDVTITSGGTMPTISWTVPGGFVPDGFRVNIYDKDRLTIGGSADVIHTVAVPPTSTSYTLPVVLSSGLSLELDGHYTINFQLIETRGHVVFTNNNAQILRRSSSFFAFSLPPDGAPANIALPTVVNGVYNFKVTDVGPDSVTFIDPVVAIGYDYATGVGDPNFASVILPDVGDGIYDVMFNGTHHTVLAGQHFFFPAGGVAAFSVRGIEATAEVDPANVVAFITGLTFVDHGSFTGTMTPIVESLPAINDLCPCASGWRNHGSYVSCVAHAADGLVADGLITPAEKDAIVSTAAQSSCGRND